MAETLDTLFSFELLVEYVHLDKLAKGTRQLKPAVGVRLLDFPTLLIYPRNAVESEEQQDSDSEKENKLGRDLMLEPQSGTSEYSFCKGKSCLFKIGLDLLHLHLSNTPLYVMVLDLSSEIPKFVGGSLIPLAKLTERIKGDVELHGIWTPSAHGERAFIPVFNLMGEKIGNISLGYKLLSLGASLMPHIAESQIYKVGCTEGKEKTARFTHEVNSGEKATVTLQPELDSSAVLCQKVELEGKQTNIIVSETKAKMESVKSTGTQTEDRKKKGTSSEVSRSTFDSETNPAVFCPPPLYYRRSVKRPEERSLIRFTSADVGVQGFSAENLCSEEAEQATGDEPLKSCLCHHTDNTTISRLPLAPPQPLGNTIRQLPLLNALLLELSQLNIQPQQQPLPGHLNPDGLYQPEPEHPSSGVSDGGSKPQVPNTAFSPKPRAKKSPSPRTRANNCSGCSASLTKMGTAKCQKLKQAKLPSGSIPKRKLVYGLTNTFRLRMLRTNPELLKKHEYREQHYKAKTQQIMHNVKHSEADTRIRSHKPDGIKRRDVFNRTVMPDKNVQTLNSGVKDSPQEECARLQSRNKQEYVRSPVHKSSESSDQSFSFSPADNSKGSLKKKPLLFHKEKEMLVHVPSVLSQNSNHNDNEGLWTDVSRPQSNTANLTAHNMSPVHKFSDSEQVEYLDDFEATEGSSPDFLSSPEPALRNSRRADSEDRFSLDSGPQHGQEAALPTPVRGGTSPQHTLKDTHLIRARVQSSYDSDAGSDSVRPTHHHLFQQTSNSPSTPCDLGSSMSQPSDCLRDTPSVLDSCKPTNDSAPESVPSPGLEVSFMEEKDTEIGDELGSLGFENKYHHISELVINKLPGYTL
ncbi:microtubule-associated protein 10 [Arapaima gigas]